MKRLPTATVLALALVLQASIARAQEHSDLWGRAGEKWTETSRLPDFSHAGYRCGEKAIPTVPQVANVRSFGAVGDGRHDDSEAFVKAIAAATQGAVYVPPGRYKITRILEINKSGVVLRGAGADKTTLYFPTPLNDIEPNWGSTTSGRRTSNYSWSGGFIWFKGPRRSTRITSIEGAAQRGGRELKVRSAEGMKAQQWVEITLRDDDTKSLVKHLYSGDPGDTGKIKPSSHGASLACRIVSAERGRIVIDRPLPFDVAPAWSPGVRQFDPTVTESGVEDLSVEFPARAYQRHFTELGYNAIAFSNAAHCWARNITIVNADSGIMAGGQFCTMQRITFEAPGGRRAKGDVFGHHGIYLQRNDNLFTEFDFRVRFIHDITVSHCSGNVSSNGKGVDICFDHHKRAPYANLFTHIDLGEGSRMWRCGGGRSLGRQSGGGETFWNIRARRPQRHPGGFGPAAMNLVAVQTDQPSTPEPDGIWFEAIGPERIRPQNLHEAQLARRLAK